MSADLIRKTISSCFIVFSLFLTFAANMPLEGVANYLVNASYFANFDRGCYKGDSQEEKIKQLELYHFTPIGSPYSLLILNFNAFEFNHDYNGLDGGVGFRFTPSPNTILGINAHYTYQDDIGALHQVSGGIEIIHRFASFYANIYTPVGTKKHHKRFVYDDYVGNYTAVCLQDTIATTRFDAALIKEFKPTSTIDLQLFLGLFSFESCCQSRMIRSEIGFKSIFQNLYVFPRYMYDSIHKSQFTLEMGFRFPSYDSNFYRKRLRKPFVRRNPIYTTRNCNYTTNFESI